MPGPRGRQAHSITVLNLKGGVGKTHTLWMLASLCEERGQRLLAIDTDTQGNLTNSLLQEADDRPGIEALFDPAGEPDPASLIRRTNLTYVDLLPSGPALAPYDLTDQGTWQQADLQFALAEAVQELRPRYDFIVFDCPPRLSLVSFAALCASDFVVIPLEAADWGAQGVAQVAQAIDYVRERYNPRLELLGYLVSRFKRARSYQRSYLAQLRDHFGKMAFDTVVPDLARYEKSVTHGVPITLFAPSSPEAGIARRLFAEIQRRISRSRRRRGGSRTKDVHVASQVAA